jgi:alpha-amylase
MTSHDDGQPFDKERTMPYKTATMLLLTPGTSQVYYGDESARDLTIDHTVGDATLRSFMNWNDIKTKEETQKIVDHWQKIGQFRANHMSLGAGRHHLISEEDGLIFSRIRKEDKIIVGINLPKGNKVLNVSSIFKNGEKLNDFYSNQIIEVKAGKITLNSAFDLVLLEKLIPKN